MVSTSSTIAASTLELGLEAGGGTVWAPGDATAVIVVVVVEVVVAECDNIG